MKIVFDITDIKALGDYFHISNDNSGFDKVEPLTIEFEKDVTRTLKVIEQYLTLDLIQKIDGLMSTHSLPFSAFKFWVHNPSTDSYWKFMPSPEDFQ